MKKILKNNLPGFILGIILCSGVIYGVNLYKSEDIQYQPSDDSWEVSNVSDALNSLYNNKSLSDGVYQLDVSMIIGYQSSNYATTRFSPLCKLKVENGEVSILEFNDNYQSVNIIGKNISVDPSELTLTKIS